MSTLLLLLLALSNVEDAPAAAGLYVPENLYIARDDIGQMFAYTCDADCIHPFNADLVCDIGELATAMEEAQLLLFQGSVCAYELDALYRSEVDSLRAKADCIESREKKLSHVQDVFGRCIKAFRAVPLPSPAHD